MLRQQKEGRNKQPAGKKRNEMEETKRQLYENQLRRLFKAAGQNSPDTPKTPARREKIRVIRRRKGGPDQYITESA